MAVLLGISFPFRKGATGFPEPTTDDDLIRDSLIQLVLTGTGERLMRPQVGTNARRFVFEPNNDLLSSLIQTEITSAVERFEPRVTLLAVDSLRNESSVSVTITYIVNATQQLGTVGVTI